MGAESKSRATDISWLASCDARIEDQMRERDTETLQIFVFVFLLGYGRTVFFPLLFFLFASIAYPLHEALYPISLLIFPEFDIHLRSVVSSI